MAEITMIKCDQHNCKSMVEYDKAVGWLRVKYAPGEFHVWSWFDQEGPTLVLTGLAQGHLCSAACAIKMMSQSMESYTTAPVEAETYERAY